MKTLHLNLKRKWFDMILSGEKTEEYREIKPYWLTRLLKGFNAPYPAFRSENLMQTYAGSNGKFLIELLQPEFKTITFKNGYQKNAPTFTIECLGIEIGKAKPEWSDNWKGDVFIIKLGEIITN